MHGTQRMISLVQRIAAKKYLKSQPGRQVDRLFKRIKNGNNLKH